MHAHLLDQPGAERLVFGLAGLAHEVLAEVPVGAVQNAHLAVILMKNNPATLPVHTGRSKYSMGATAAKAESAQSPHHSTTRRIATHEANPPYRFTDL
jgi:hypothetical protein